MDLDVSVNGQWASSIGAILVERNIPGLPEVNENIIEVAGRDGALDFGSSYSPRPIGLGLFIAGDDYDNTVGLIMRMFNIRRGQLDIVFSDRPGKHYYAQYRGTMGFDESAGNRIVEIPLKMYDPFPRLEEKISELTITKSPQVITVDSIGDERTSPVIVLTNIGNTTLSNFKITNEYER